MRIGFVMAAFVMAVFVMAVFDLISEFRNDRKKKFQAESHQPIESA